MGKSSLDHANIQSSEEWAEEAQAKKKKKKEEEEEDWKNVTDAEQGQGWSNQLGESLWRV